MYVGDRVLGVSVCLGSRANVMKETVLIDSQHLCLMILEVRRPDGSQSLVKACFHDVWDLLCPLPLCVLGVCLVLTKLFVCF